MEPVSVNVICARLKHRVPESMPWTFAMTMAMSMLVLGSTPVIGYSFIYRTHIANRESWCFIYLFFLI